MRGGAQLELLQFYRRLLAIRHALIMPRLANMGGAAGEFDLLSPRGLRVNWRLGDGSTLQLLANFSAQALVPVRAPCGELIFCAPSNAFASLQRGTLEPWSVVWLLQAGKLKDSEDELRPA